ncbi:MAG: heavy metal transport/detoxification protein [Methylobacter sp.]|nr:MAG: heavy metal transport/detoxification protein [Methylobacter sp.]
MHCFGCEEAINDSLKGMSGIIKAEADYRRQTAKIVYDTRLISELAIRQHIEAKGYGVDEASRPFFKKAIQTLIFLLLLASVGGLAWWGKNLIPGILQQINPHMNPTLLFGIGVLTGFHCIGMCGGFVVGYTVAGQSKARQLGAHLLYGLGKTLSYTTLGAGSGLLGSIIAITPLMRGTVTLLASGFVLLYGLKILNVFSLLRRFSLRWPRIINRQVADSLRRHRSPLSIGLLNGLVLGCGPLQAIYVMAAGTGDPLQGALFLLIFGLGTLLPLTGFGLFAVLLSPTAIRQLLSVSGILVIVMGLMMAQRGLKLLSPVESMLSPAQLQTSAPLPLQKKSSKTQAGI